MQVDGDKDYIYIESEEQYRVWEIVSYCSTCMKIRRQLEEKLRDQLTPWSAYLSDSNVDIKSFMTYYSRNCIMMPKKRAKIEKYVEELKLKVVTWLGGICFPLRTSSSKVPKLYMTLSGVIRPAS